MPVDVVFFNVGQGDCTFIQSWTVESGARKVLGSVLLDCGSTKASRPLSPSGGGSGDGKEEMVAHLRVELDKLLKSRPRLDCLMVSHPDEDHFNLIEEVLWKDGKSRYQIDRFLYTAEPGHYREGGRDFVRNLIEKSTNLTNASERCYYPVSPRPFDIGFGRAGDGARLLLVSAQLLSPTPDLWFTRHYGVNEREREYVKQREAAVRERVAAIRLDPSDPDHPGAKPDRSWAKGITVKVRAQIEGAPSEVERLRKLADQVLVDDKGRWSNSISIVLLLLGAKASDGKRQKVWLMADAIEENETTIAEQYKKADLPELGGEARNVWLKVGHHGSKTSTSGPWIKWLAPGGMFISSGTKLFNGSYIPSSSHVDAILAAWRGISPKPAIGRSDTEPHCYAYYQERVKGKGRSGFAMKGAGAKPDDESVFTSLFLKERKATKATRTGDIPAVDEFGRDWHLTLDHPKPGDYRLRLLGEHPLP
ncbi:hypothetical protein [Kitasatospora sp. CB02891]|uniref:hypothetical protein n=1 Tax=Kitasatospora sp. CB02891 TaxID=2020329 RepID=UPI000C270C39|nr:hypothetical protein [Kitasatospora sp. CB02891]PJN27779.1 hypothetical protein CG736_06085 [Kitasatospora sp. CB02891]